MFSFDDENDKKEVVSNKETTDERLLSFLGEIAKELEHESQYTNLINELKEIYTNDFRHSYSKINQQLMDISNGNLVLLDLMANNISEINKIVSREHSNNKEDEFSKKIFKLFDHINLERNRIYFTTHKAKEALDQAKEATEKSKEAINNTKREFNKIQSKLNKTQSHYITILGIFASIIIAFVGAFTFSTSVLNNIDKVSIYRLIGIICILAVFIVNILNSLYSFVRQIHYGKINKATNFNFTKWFNIIMLVIIILTAFTWYLFHPYENNTSKDTNINLNIPGISLSPPR
ncbi:hypothetical protein [Campylobacter sp. 7477a]|uniref:hypothetical protein n=1 Tax=Campylobacter sp. 7477a TaxID=2735741 RepID=UPI003014D99D|nr:hypothetical protein [Campylobacter sp. 7477a]